MSATFKIGDRVRTRPGMAFHRQGVVVEVQAHDRYPRIIIEAAPDTPDTPVGSVRAAYWAGELEHVDPQPDTAPSAIPIGRPVIRLERGAHGAPHRVVCTHCPWTYSSDALVVVREHANYHRGQHRAGLIEGTR
ncbi:hypothetical protein [Sanguibacter sp. HDW7]|uniref:hypothetical protein n=1 Tax=Sanguibacter sp. HDW7 TaxID=2714931 RepID=UPI00140E7902|nr:hypothetical protein [Sanguibacter sp. HDW7]QIK83014.1 hypothetical protein G7063_04765 [Sanguibacter sp. HDW7]